ncbi:MAG: NPCBM/NEW2 domain-containing protein [Pirellulaceae bacterium]|nr:NPCBM/NEW2 domain-containing protein [Pirellulaceae bacterium]
MPDSFDPYHQWLGIRDLARPPSHYRLLGIETFESNREVIATAADRQMAHLRTYQQGKNVDLSERLLNEVSAAKVCLLDPEKKSEYDRRLRETESPDAPPPWDPELDSFSNGNRPEIVVSEQDQGVLNRPGRSIRKGNLGRRLPTVVLVISLVILIAMVTFRFINHSADRNSVAGKDLVEFEQSTKQDEKVAPADDGVEEQLQAEESPTEENREERSEVEAINPSKPDAETQEQPSDSVSETSGGETEADQVNPPEPWAPVRMTAGPRPEFSAKDPFEAVLLELSNRNLKAAVTAAKRAQQFDTVRDRQKYDRAKLLLYNMQRFWQSVDEAKSALQKGTTLSYRGETVTVRQVDSLQITLETVNGQIKKFDLPTQALDVELAISLVEHRFKQAAPVGWRWIGNFLLIDKFGDITRGQEYLKRAESHGFDADFIVRALEMVTGEDHGKVVAVPTSDDENLERTKTGQTNDSRLPVPAAAVQTATRQELKKQDMLESEAARCLEIAREEDDRPDAQFVLLKEAARLSLIDQDLETGLAAIDLLSERYRVNQGDLQFDFLQRLSRSSKRDQRGGLVDAALHISELGVSGDDYSSANRFSDLANSIGGRLTRNASLRTRLSRHREKIKSIANDFEASQEARDRLVENSDDPAANATVGKFLCFTKGDFEAGLPHLKLGQDAALRKLAAADLANPRNAEDRKQVAKSWQTYARKGKGLVPLHALERARHWYQLSLVGLPVAQTGPTRKILNEISAAIGRQERLLDVTVLHPNASKGGYGGLGINENTSASVGPIHELPRLGRQPISRFLWAHAPSMVEYDVPEGAKMFRAVAVLNADSTDGAEFVVQVDGKKFSSGLVKTRGRTIPISIPLPEKAKKIVLRVESQKSAQGDETYWVNPEFTF